MHTKAELMCAIDTPGSPDTFEIQRRPTRTIQRQQCAGTGVFAATQRGGGVARGVQAELHRAEDRLPVPVAARV